MADNIAPSPPPDDRDARARRYHRLLLVVQLADVLVTGILLVAWGLGGVSHRLARWLAGLVPDWAVPPVVALVVGASVVVLSLPLDLAGGWILPRRAGLSTQSAGTWLADHAKRSAIGSLLLILAVAGLYALLRASPRWWWALGAGLLEAGAVALAWALPRWLVPLFYRLAPLEDLELRARLLALAARVGVPAVEVLVADFSRKGPTANAAVVGLGRTRRIVVSDTVLSGFPPAEVEVIVAHELAHHARGHLSQGLALQGLLFLVGLAVADRVLLAVAPALGLAGPADPAGVPFLGLVLSALALLATPLTAAWSRRLEREADRSALVTTGAVAAFIGAMERLRTLNLAEGRPGRLRQLLFATHPSIEERIAAARAFPARG